MMDGNASIASKQSNCMDNQVSTLHAFNRNTKTTLFKRNTEYASGIESEANHEKGTECNNNNLTGTQLDFEDIMKYRHRSHSLVPQRQQLKAMVDAKQTVEELNNDEFHEMMENRNDGQRNSLTMMESSDDSMDEAEADNKSNSGSSVQSANVWEEWDPMREFYTSVRNLNSKDAQYAAIGVTHFKGTLCPHANKTGGCYKGTRCPYEHHIDQAKLENPKMAVPMELSKVPHFSCLPNKPLGPGTSVFIGTFTFIVSPQEFYVIPKYSIRCLCRENFEKGVKVMDPLIAMSKQLESFYTKHDFRNEISFGMHQLAVVRIKGKTRDEQSHYYRAVAVDGATVIEDNSVPHVKCFLFDVGTTMVVALSDMSKLSKYFCNFAPMAYKCSLFGVSPIYRQYPAAVRTLFLDLLAGKEALVSIQRPYYPIQDRVSIIEPTPYMVSLRVATKSPANIEDLELVDVRNEILKTNYGLEWNLNIHRPLAWDGVTEREMEIVEDKKFDSSLDSNSRERDTKIMEEMIEDIMERIAKECQNESPSPASSFSSFRTAMGTGSDQTGVSNSPISN